ncbi:putative Fic (Filamentation induced by cAMP) protein [Burkholderiales bacterium]|nr:putative Fic (Filamentation induced by cAMP) protein [Burkholderiales bacterium]
MAKRHIQEAILDYLSEREAKGLETVGADEIAAHLGEPRPTVNRHMSKLVAAHRVLRVGAARATAYKIAKPVLTEVAVVEATKAKDTVTATVSPTWSPAAAALRAQLEAPLATRAPVSYRRSFVDDYQPNESSLLPATLAQQLFSEGRSPGQQPAATFARKVLEQLLIDLSWYSSRLEGNRKSLLDTRELFAKGRSEGDDLDATMLLNHKDAIEFMVDAVPTEGITVPVVRNLQSLLMQGLLANSDSLGAIRRTLVNITDTVYVPTQVPSLLEEMLALVVEKARNVRNPLEAAFFLWVNLAYLQPFEDGNKRTSRLCANMPLMLANCAPLSFLDVEPVDYATAMLGVYERLDVTLAVELFAWTYRRSIAKYQAVLASMGAPNPIRTKYREHLGELVRQVVFYGASFTHAVESLALPEEDRAPFVAIAQDELKHLEPYNCARFRLPIGKTQEWIAKGRPGI